MAGQRQPPGGVPTWPSLKIQEWVQKELEEKDEVPLPKDIAADHPVIRRVWNVGFPEEKPKKGESEKWLKEDREFLFKACRDKWAYSKSEMYLNRTDQALRLVIYKSNKKLSVSETSSRRQNFANKPKGAKQSSSKGEVQQPKRRATGRTSRGRNAAVNPEPSLAIQEPAPGNKEPTPGSQQSSPGSHQSSPGSQKLSTRDSQDSSAEEGPTPKKGTAPKERPVPQEEPTPTDEPALTIQANSTQKSQQPGSQQPSPEIRVPTPTSQAPANPVPNQDIVAANDDLDHQFRGQNAVPRASAEFPVSVRLPPIWQAVNTPLPQSLELPPIMPHNLLRYDRQVVRSLGPFRDV